MKKNRSLLRILFCVLLVAALSVQVLASADQGRDKECSLKLSYRLDAQTPVKGVPFGIFRVGEIMDDNSFKLTEDFKATDIALNDVPDTETWMQKAAALGAYAISESITPTAFANTDAEGCVEFTGLKQGLYLIYGVEDEIDKVIYTPTPFLLRLPDLQGGRWDYDLEAVVKHTESEPATEHSVIVAWDDGSDVNGRPKSVTVKLTKNGKVVDTRKLTRENDWRWTWSDLPAYDEDGNAIRWSVLESSVNGYTISYSEQGYTTVITNKKVVPPAKPSLPQTGQEWTAVPVLAGVGVLFLLVGLVRRKKKA